MIFSTHKFGSNVIEKCLIHGDKKQREDLINEMLAARLTEEEPYSSQTGGPNSISLTE
jgi:hypothetical protein